MKIGKYSLLDILELQNLDQFIVPEIQRDYVWGVNDVKDLLESIKDGFSSEKADIPYLGFIYAYNDKDYLYKYFLIDGQQRITSIYLLLLACHQHLNKKLPDYLISHGRLKLDYKVRVSTHDFFEELVGYCQTHSGYCSNFKIEDQDWYHQEYKNDITIKNIIQNYNFINSWLDGMDNDSIQKFMKFVEDKVEISFFDIDSGRQGEDLYIYMNSRGRELEANETLKAKFLTRIESENIKLSWGKKWEDWQDFFWRNRDEENSTDADIGFNEFLKMVQIVEMISLDNNSSEISKFAKSNQNPSIELLPNDLNEINCYFSAFSWLVGTEQVTSFFHKYEKSEHYLTASKGRDLIDYLRLLPVLVFLAKTGSTEIETVMRFIRFIYNVSRKENVRKDVAGQLSIAVKLMLEYSDSAKDEYDVCDLIDYYKGRTTFIDNEEILKLSIYKNENGTFNRHEVESVFWEAEDNFIFKGEIKFLLDRYYSKDEHVLDLVNMKETLSALKSLSLDSDKTNSAMITRTLLFYGNTWIQDTPYYYSNYNCQNWFTVVRSESGKHLLNLLEDLSGKTVQYLDTILKNKMKEYFVQKNHTTIESIKAEDSLFNQVKVLAAIDYYSTKLLWKNYSYIANDRFTYVGDVPFFKNNRVIHHVSRYIRDGWEGRVIPMMKSILQDEARLIQVISQILAFDSSEA